MPDIERDDAAAVLDSAAPAVEFDDADDDLECAKDPNDGAGNCELTLDDAISYSPVEREEKKEHRFFTRSPL